MYLLLPFNPLSLIKSLFEIEFLKYKTITKIFFQIKFISKESAMSYASNSIKNDDFSSSLACFIAGFIVSIFCELFSFLFKIIIEKLIRVLFQLNNIFLIIFIDFHFTDSYIKSIELR